jgi:hypothetical protein
MTFSVAAKPQKDGGLAPATATASRCNATPLEQTPLPNVLLHSAASVVTSASDAATSKQFSAALEGKQFSTAQQQFSAALEGKQFSTAQQQFSAALEGKQFSTAQQQFSAAPEGTKVAEHIGVGPATARTSTVHAHPHEEQSPASAEALLATGPFEYSVSPSDVECSDSLTFADYAPTKPSRCFLSHVHVLAW